MHISFKISRGTIIPLDKIWAKLAVFFACGLWLTACTPWGASPTLKIGLVAPFEGLHRSLGYEALFAVKLALRERNATGGLHGVQVELVALNDFDEPAEATRQAQALVADPAVVGVVGHLSSEATLAALPVYQAADLAVAVPWSIAALPPESRAGVVSLAADQAEAITRLERLAAARGQAPLRLLSPVADGSLEAAGPALLLTDAVTAGEIIVAFDQVGMNPPLFGGPAAGSSQLIEVAGSKANGFIFVSPGPDPTTLPAAADFVTAYQGLAGFPPGPRAVLAYEATQVLLDAIEAALADSGRLPARSDIRATINTVQRLGLSGDLTFDSQGQRRQPPLWLYQISDDTYPGRLLAP